MCNGDGRVAFQSTCCCRSNDYKNGNVADAWKHLHDKYAPNMAPIKLELKSEFQQTKLQDALVDLNVWISNLKLIHARLADMKAGISDEDLFVHVLNSLPKEYEVQINKLEEQFGSVKNPLTIQDMQNKLNMKFAQLKHQSEEQSEIDQVLVAFHFYKEKCENCGKFGHKSMECHSKSELTKKEEGQEAQKSKKGKNVTDKRHITCFVVERKGTTRASVQRMRTKKKKRQTSQTQHSMAKEQC